MWLGGGASSRLDIWARALGPSAPGSLLRRQDRPKARWDRWSVCGRAAAADPRPLVGSPLGGGQGRGLGHGRLTLLGRRRKYRARLFFRGRRRASVVWSGLESGPRRGEGVVGASVAPEQERGTPDAPMPLGRDGGGCRQGIGGLLGAIGDGGVGRWRPTAADKAGGPGPF